MNRLENNRHTSRATLETRPLSSSKMTQQGALLPTKVVPLLNQVQNQVQSRTNPHPETRSMLLVFAGRVSSGSVAIAGMAGPAGFATSLINEQM
mmetsp:Transcript_24274/g.52842  ORF Transcript_24274/g.52842 Transcript_24274/m.52842 type:complete len:94 (-) Transcript_24274:152-433(-)